MTDGQCIQVRGACEHNLKDLSLDIPKMDNIDRLVNDQNTGNIIEHHLDVIRQADWIIDLGPDGGSAGGEALFEGPPLALKNCERSITPKYI